MAHMQRIQIFQHGGLWIAHLQSSYGHMEFLCGEGNEPDIRSLILIEQFFDGLDDHISTIRRSVFRMPRLWRPIRFAINDQGRLGLQFKNRVTGKQEGMFFADEHSSFTKKLSDITLSDADLQRLEERHWNV